MLTKKAILFAILIVIQLILFHHVQQTNAMKKMLVKMMKKDKMKTIALLYALAKKKMKPKFGILPIPIPIPFEVKIKEEYDYPKYEYSYPSYPSIPDYGGGYGGGYSDSYGGGGSGYDLDDYDSGDYKPDMSYMNEDIYDSSGLDYGAFGGESGYGGSYSGGDYNGNYIGPSYSSSNNYKSMGSSSGDYVGPGQYKVTFDDGYGGGDDYGSGGGGSSYGMPYGKGGSSYTIGAGGRDGYDNYGDGGGGGYADNYGSNNGEYGSGISSYSSGRGSYTGDYATSGSNDYITTGNNNYDPPTRNYNKNINNYNHPATDSGPRAIFVTIGQSSDVVNPNYRYSSSSFNNNNDYYSQSYRESNNYSPVAVPSTTNDKNYKTYEDQYRSNEYRVENHHGTDPFAKTYVSNEVKPIDHHDYHSENGRTYSSDMSKKNYDQSINDYSQSSSSTSSYTDDPYSAKSSNTEFRIAIIAADTDDKSTSESKIKAIIEPLEPSTEDKHKVQIGSITISPKENNGTQ